MDKDFVEEIYGYAYTVSRLRQVVAGIRIMDDLHALELLKKILKDVQKLGRACLQDGYVEAECLWENIQSIAVIKDMIFLGDMLENVAIPIMERWIQSCGIISEQIDENYRIESTSVGFLTIKHIGADRYFHSNNDPMEEARLIVSKQFDYKKSRYLVVGCGLGYHIYQLYQYSMGSVPIRVHEPDAKLVDYAMEYGVLSWIPKDVLEIVTEGSAEKFLSLRKDSDGVFYLLPYIRTTKNEQSKNFLTREYIQQSSVWEGSHELLLNFNRNKELGLPDVKLIDRSGIKEEMVVIAGGPSIDHVVDTIRKWKNKKTLIAVGTIWKRLLKEGIFPDYVVIVDPYEATCRQIEGIDDISSVLLLGMAAYWRLARIYQGPVYTICMESQGCGMEEYANEHELEIWESGGTVTALAMEFAIRFGAKRVYLAGADLAFPGGISHAEGTVQRSNVDTSGMHPIEGVNGDTVYADDIFMMYRQWMEYRIAKASRVDFVNMSDVGAKIKGARKMADADRMN